MVRFTTHDKTLLGDAAFAARGEHKALLEASDAAHAMRHALPWLTWGTEDGLDALPYGEWLYVVLMGATIATDVDTELFDEHSISMSCTARLWTAKRASGLIFEEHMDPPRLHLISVAAAKAAGPTAMRVTHADLVKTQTRPEDPESVRIAALHIAAGTGTAAARAAAKAIATTATADAAARTPPWQTVATHLRYADLIRADRDAGTVAQLEYFLHSRLTTVQRCADSDCERAWRGIVKAVDGGATGSAQALRHLEQDEPASIVAEALRASRLPSILATAHPRLTDRRRDATRRISLKGKPDAAMITECLPAMLDSGELDRLRAICAGEAVPQRILSLIEEVAALLKQDATTLSEARLRAIERALGATSARAAGKTAEERLADLAEKLAARALADATAPKHEGTLQAGHPGTAGPMAAVTSHAKAQQEALFTLYETKNFSQQETALLRLTTPEGVLHLALTARFLGDVGEADGPANAAEAALALLWAPVAVFHQLIWGKVQSLQSKEGLRKLFTLRIYMPQLLGTLAARELRGTDAAGDERLAALQLTTFWEQLKAQAWGNGKLDFVNDLLVPVMCAYHDLKPADQPRLHGGARYDPALLAAVTPILAGVMTLCGVPRGGSAHTVRAWLTPVLDLFALHAPAASPGQLETLSQAAQAYIETSLHDYSIVFNQTRHEADPSATFVAKLGDGQGLVTLNQVLRAFNNAAARKRAADGTSDPGYASILRLPRTAFSAQQGPAFTPRASDTSPAPTGKKVALAAASGDNSPIMTTSTGFAYDVEKAMAKLAELGSASSCAMALLCYDCRDDNVRLANVKAGCPCYGQVGHIGHGSSGKGKHAPVAGFRPAQFLTAVPDWVADRKTAFKKGRIK